MMTPKEFLEFQYGIDLGKYMDEKRIIHPGFLTKIMEEYGDHVLLSKVTEATQKNLDDSIRKYRLSLLEEIKFGFDICSDMSTYCLGYRNLVDRIKREKENKPIDKSISPIKPYKNE